MVPKPWLQPPAWGAEHPSSPSRSFWPLSHSGFLSLCTIKQLPEKLQFIPPKKQAQFQINIWDPQVYCLLPQQNFFPILFCFSPIAPNSPLLWCQLLRKSFGLIKVLLWLTAPSYIKQPCRGEQDNRAANPMVPPGELVRKNGQTLSPEAICEENE